MDPHRGYRALVPVIAIFALLLGLALTITPVGVAQDASPAAKEQPACPEASPKAGATPSANATPCPAGTPKAQAADEVTIDSFDIYFEPKEVTIPADTDVKFILPNKGVTMHNFSIDALKVDVDIDPGATEETTIKAPAGEYEYYCNVPGHKAAGMVGTLIVK